MTILISSVQYDDMQRILNALDTPKSDTEIDTLRPLAGSISTLVEFKMIRKCRLSGYYLKKPGTLLSAVFTRSS